MDSHRADALMFLSGNQDYTGPRPMEYLMEDAWHTLIRAYTERLLTKGTNRVLAVSGLAGTFEHFLEGPRRHVAGLWVDKLPQMLLWYNSVHDRADPMGSHDDPGTKLVLD